MSRTQFIFNPAQFVQHPPNLALLASGSAEGGRTHFRFDPQAAKPGFSPVWQQEETKEVDNLPASISVRRKQAAGVAPPNIDGHRDNFPYFIFDVSLPTAPSVPQSFRCTHDTHTKPLAQLCTYLPRHANCRLCLSCVHQSSHLPHPQCTDCHCEYSPEEVALIRSHERDG